MKKENLIVLDMEGTGFYFDQKGKELREVNNPKNTIRFADMDADEDYHHFYYNAKTKKQHTEKVKDETKLPKHVRAVLLETDAIMGRKAPCLVRVIPMVKDTQEFKDIQKRYLKNVRVKIKEKKKLKL